MPMKLLPGSVMFWNVSSVTATPGMPAKPSPLPESPTRFGVPPCVASANTSATPSAPLPPFMVASKLMVIGTARLRVVVQNELPASATCPARRELHAAGDAAPAPLNDQPAAVDEAEGASVATLAAAADAARTAETTATVTTCRVRNLLRTEPMPHIKPAPYPILH